MRGVMASETDIDLFDVETEEAFIYDRWHFRRSTCKLLRISLSIWMVKGFTLEFEADSKQVFSEQLAQH